MHHMISNPLFIPIRISFHIDAMVSTVQPLICQMIFTQETL